MSKIFDIAVEKIPYDVIEIVDQIFINKIKSKMKRTNKQLDNDLFKANLEIERLTLLLNSKKELGQKLVEANKEILSLKQQWENARDNNKELRSSRHDYFTMYNDERKRCELFENQLKAVRAIIDIKNPPIVNVPVQFKSPNDHV